MKYYFEKICKKDKTVICQKQGQGLIVTVSSRSLLIWIRRVRGQNGDPDIIQEISILEPIRDHPNELPRSFQINSVYWEIIPMSVKTRPNFPSVNIF